MLLWRGAVGTLDLRQPQVILDLLLILVVPDTQTARHIVSIYIILASVLNL